MDCDKVLSDLDKIISVAIDAKNMIRAANTGKEFSAALDQIEYGVNGIREELNTPLPPRRYGPFDNA